MWGIFNKACFKNFFITRCSMPDESVSRERVFVMTVEKARREWIWSKKLVSEATDRDLIDRAIFCEGAAERRYVHLLKKAAEENVRVDEAMIVFLALADHNGSGRGRVE